MPKTLSLIFAVKVLVAKAGLVSDLSIRERKKGKKTRVIRGLGEQRESIVV